MCRLYYNTVTFLKIPKSLAGKCREYCAYAKSPSLEGSNEGDLPHLGFQRLTCMYMGLIKGEENK